MTSAHNKYISMNKKNEIPLDEMSAEELKMKLKQLTGKTTRIRKHEKLLELVKDELTKFALSTMTSDKGNH